MKTFFVKNLIVVFALLLGIGTMSFKMVEKSNEEVTWFSVDYDDQQTIGGQVDPGTCFGSGKICAIGFTQDTPPATTVSEAQNDESYYGIETRL